MLSPAPAADWPMWRHDAGRTAASAATLPETLNIRWTRQLPPPAPAYRDVRLQFDAAIEPIVLGKRLFFGSTVDDSLTALDTETGKELWKFRTGGPVRCAPAGGEGRIIFGSDDGCVYCLKASDGSLVWKHRTVPSRRMLLGNDRLISAWPVRGGPVLHQGRVYFAAGVWPVEGAFVYCLDAASGKVIWRNDRVSCLYDIHPHNAEAFGGLAPQGYLLIDGGDLVVPNSQAYPARFDLATGKLKELKLPASGRLPGGWFTSTPSEKEALKLKRRGLLFDDEVNAKPHEDNLRKEGLPGIRNTIRSGDREIRFDEIRYGDGNTIPGVNSALIGDGKLFVATASGLLWCLDGGETSAAIPTAASPGKVPAGRLADLPPALRSEHGFALFLEDDSGSPGDLARASDSRCVLIHSGRSVIDRWNAQGETASSALPAGKLATLHEPDFSRIEFPRYFADLIVLGKPLFDGPKPRLDRARLETLYQSLRPFGGRMVAQSTQLQRIAKASSLPRASIAETPGGWTVITREGALEGSSNYTGDWAPSPDALVRAPFGVLWFGDSVVHFKRSPQPKFIDGVMISNPKDWTDASTRQGKVDYRLLDTEFTDVYTGRILQKDEATALRQSFTGVDLTTIQPGQYRPPRQKDDWNPEAPRAGDRINPLTGEQEARTFPKSYGCDGGSDYGLLYTMRSGTPAVYDKVTESGTINISGPRSGCTNSIIPANGLLNLPFFYEGCTCSYPLPMAVALVGMPETFEQWASWGAVPRENLHGRIQRIGLNFGAPGDRMTRDGTLWLDAPSAGGPSPDLELQTTPPLADLETFYRHSVFQTEAGAGWPWVAGSGVIGVHRVELGGLRPGEYTVRMTIAAPAETPASDRGELSVTVAGSPRQVPSKKPEVLQWDRVAVPDTGLLEVTLSAAHGETCLSGIEVIASHLPNEKPGNKTPAGHSR